MSEIEAAAIDKIKLYHQQMLEMQTQVSVKQGQILTIVELMGWDASQANEFLGVAMFSVPEKTQTTNGA